MTWSICKTQIGLFLIWTQLSRHKKQPPTTFKTKETTNHKLKTKLTNSYWTGLLFVLNHLHNHRSRGEVSKSYMCTSKKWNVFYKWSIQCLQNGLILHFLPSSSHRFIISCKYRSFILLASDNLGRYILRLQWMNKNLINK